MQKLNNGKDMQFLLRNKKKNEHQNMNATVIDNLIIIYFYIRYV